MILPLLIVLSITAIKDGYEDVKRDQSDRHVNHSQVRILSGEWTNPNPTMRKNQSLFRGISSKVRRRRVAVNPSGNESAGEPRVSSGSIAASPFRESTDRPAVELANVHHPSGDGSRNDPHWKLTLWEDVRVGDFIKIVDNQSFPADILICATSENDNVAFVETKNLDGETNLKSRHAVQELTHLRSAADCANKRNAFHVDCDRPDGNMYRLNAALVKGGERYPVDINMTLLRGTVLRNTTWVIGIVLFTGGDTKIVMNSGGTPSKRSKVERQMNPQV